MGEVLLYIILARLDTVHISYIHPYIHTSIHPSIHTLGSIPYPETVMVGWLVSNRKQDGTGQDYWRLAERR